MNPNLIHSPEWASCFTPSVVDDLGLSEELVNFYRLTFWTESWPTTRATIASSSSSLDTAGTSFTMPDIFPPHMLLHGPPGTGKTTFANMVCNRFFAPFSDFAQSNVKRLNASCDRGIAIVRNQILPFASFDSRHSPLPDVKQASVNLGMSEREATRAMKLLAGRRFIILDECDNLTPESQAALRKVIEENAQNTRFILICNNYSALLDALVSRCRVFKFNHLDEDAVGHALSRIGDRASKLLPTLGGGSGGGGNKIRVAFRDPIVIQAMSAACSGDGRMLTVAARKSLSRFVASNGEMTTDELSRFIEEDANLPPQSTLDAVVMTILGIGDSESTLAKSWLSLQKMSVLVGTVSLATSLTLAINHAWSHPKNKAVVSVISLASLHTYIARWSDDSFLIEGGKSTGTKTQSLMCLFLDMVAVGRRV